MQLRTLSALFAALGAATLLGCSNTDYFVPDQMPVTAGANESIVTFYWPEDQSGQFAQILHQDANGKPEFVTHLARNQKMSYRVKPGLHVFALCGDRPFLVTGNLKGGKVYYVRLDFRESELTLPIFSAKVKHPNERFANELDAMQAVQPSEKSRKLYESGTQEDRPFRCLRKAKIGGAEGSFAHLGKENGFERAPLRERTKPSQNN